jgi:alginate O-acetyltransferase complex protein AlgI
MLEYLRNILLFNEKNPLIFTRLNFWIFFVIVLLIYSFIYKKITLRNAYLFLVSLFFYYKTGGLFLFVLIFSTLVDYTLGILIHQASSNARKKIFLITSICINIFVLAFFKYDFFFTDTINKIFGTNMEVVTHSAKWSNALFGTHFDLGKMLPPVGISFFTFQSMSYTIEIFRGNITPVRKFTDFAFYVSFFPQLVAGPIVRASEFIPQIYKKYSLSAYEFGLAFFLILKGLTKKMLIGDYIAVNLIDRVFSNPSSFSGFENLSALFGYSLQVYCDFSGYTDIAIGVALLMGFYLPKNFNSPYKAKNTGDFWKRWHMSLSTWLKDYLYIPMGGNRGGSVFTYASLAFVLLFIVLIAQELILIPIFAFVIGVIWILTRFFPGLRLNVSTNINLMMTMLIGGLWHGSSWMFIIWGGLNGLGLITYKFWRKISPYEHSNHWLANTWKIAFTFTFISFTRIWFRGETMQDAFDLLGQITSHFGWASIPGMIGNYREVFLLMLIGFIIHWLPESFKVKYRDWFINRPLYQQIGICVVAVFVIYQSASAGLQPFIYFQF